MRTEKTQPLAICSPAGLLLLLLPLLLGLPRAAQGQSAPVIGTKHDLSVPGAVSSQPCIFCHTPHNSYVVEKPIWNHQLSIQTYTLYTSTTTTAVMQQPNQPSKQCLSCHDGTVALGQTKAQGLLNTTRTLGAGKNLGVDLSNDHPISFTPVNDGQLAPSLFLVPPATKDPAVKLVAGTVECTSCHNPHIPNKDTVVPSFLVRSNSSSAICLACHDPSQPRPNRLQGWTTGSHSIATNTTPATAGFSSYGTVALNACLNCHLPHNTPANSSPRLLRGYEEAACSLCHNGTNLTPALLNVMGEFSKVYAHPTTTVSGLHDANENAFPLNASRHAECPDCHNGHAAANAGGAALPPGVQSALLGATGVSSAGGAVNPQPANNEYEVCFKCHADSTGKPQSSAYSVYGYTPFRVTFATSTDPYNVRLQMQSTASSHPVTHVRNSPYPQPSLRANMLALSYTAGRAMGTQIYCTDCHTNNQDRNFGGLGPNGPHGSTYPHILERNYQVNTPPATPGGTFPSLTYSAGINGPYALCEKCHEFTNSIFTDASFRHNLHISGAGFSCAICHSPHGVANSSTNIGPRLVNFDTRFVAQNSGRPIQFNKAGRYCDLVCHQQSHDSGMTY